MMRPRLAPRLVLSLLLLVALSAAIPPTVAMGADQVAPASDGPNPFAVWGAVATAVIATAIVVGWYLRGRTRRRR
ncbi:MAG: hypothetical protein AB7F65_11890 [Dehalococcoidia bacterium]